MNKITKIVTVLALAGMPISPISEPAPTMPSLEPVAIVEVETPEPETPVTTVTSSAPANTGNGAAPYLHQQRQTDAMGTSECAFAMGCVNLSEDEEWLAGMKSLARQLFEKGMLQLFPSFQKYF